MVEKAQVTHIYTLSVKFLLKESSYMFLRYPPLDYAKGLECQQRMGKSVTMTTAAHQYYCFNLLHVLVCFMFNSSTFCVAREQFSVCSM